MAVSGPHANVLLARIAPFCYRVLVPWTSHFIAPDHLAVRMVVQAQAQWSVWDAVSTSKFPSFDYFESITLRSWGIMVVLAAAAPLRVYARTLKERPQILMVALLQTLCGADTQRLMICAGPLVMLLAIKGMQALRIHHAVALAGLVVCQYFMFVTDYREPYIPLLVPEFHTLKVLAYAGVFFVALVVGIRTIFSASRDSEYAQGGQWPRLCSN